jgi:hypothetical protein
MQHGAPRAVHFLEAQLHRKERITGTVQRDERPDLRRKGLAERAVGAAAREGTETFGGKRARVGCVRHIPLRRPHKGRREHPPRAEAALAEGELELAIYL